jgi:hypothetical protein
MNTFVQQWGPTITLLIGIATFSASRIAETRDMRKERLASRKLREEEQAALKKQAALAEESLNEEWLQAAIHEEFHKAKDGTLSFEQVRKNLGTTAFWRSGEVTLNSSDLSSQEIRRLLVSMIEKGVIEQVLSDEYSLKFRQTSYIQDLSTQNTKALPLIEEIVRRHPQGVALAEVKAQLADQHHITIDRVQCQAILIQLQQMGLTLQSNNLWQHVDHVAPNT